MLVGDGREDPVKDVSGYLEVSLRADLDEYRETLEEHFQCFDIAGTDVKVEALY